MMIRASRVLGLVAITSGLASAPAGVAGVPSSRAAATRIVWLKPERVPASRRPALTRVLNQAVLGRPLSGASVRDTRPQLVAEEVVTWLRSSRGASAVIVTPEATATRHAR